MKSRKQAVEAGESKYFTGKPCRNGHVSFRYTQSGTCVDCVSISSKANRAQVDGSLDEFQKQREARKAKMLAPAIAARNARTEALRSLTEIRIAIHPENVYALFDIAIGLCLAAFPVLDRMDVLPATQPIRGTPLYKVRVPLDMAQTMRDVANEFWRRSNVDVERERERIQSAIERQADDDAEQPPETWK